MPWIIESEYVIKLGGNYFQNCEHILTYDDEPVFTIKRRENDSRLGVDFEIRDEQGHRVATVRGGNVVQRDVNAYDVHHGAERQRMTEKTTGRVVYEIDKCPDERHVELALTVTMYLPDGFLLKADPDKINVAGMLVTGNVIRGCWAGIAIGECTKSAGIRLEKPRTK